MKGNIWAKVFIVVLILPLVIYFLSLDVNALTTGAIRGKSGDVYVLGVQSELFWGKFILNLVYGFASTLAAVLIIFGESDESDESDESNKK
ncbi:hypothetical protein GCM10011613_02090 [Cellvibrio zantedeschiae]|uniref:Uncharacterized protein n=1 Tax=Cellvibrio zantedeschiae TaxID=1237077 RepID=A0ABQ3ARY8_9GAMM|nr:hypothetical protein [Cellvibrio zantedeschiae]GGY62212.1 hypothetical protein GCM10011613_02090 [Cellvibrio zantedeschiae]